MHESIHEKVYWKKIAMCVREKGLPVIVSCPGSSIDSLQRRKEVKKSLVKLHTNAGNYFEFLNGHSLE